MFGLKNIFGLGSPEVQGPREKAKATRPEAREASTPKEKATVGSPMYEPVGLTPGYEGWGKRPELELGEKVENIHEGATPPTVETPEPVKLERAAIQIPEPDLLPPRPEGTADISAERLTRLRKELHQKLAEAKELIQLIRDTERRRDMAREPEIRDRFNRDLNELVNTKWPEIKLVIEEIVTEIDVVKSELKRRNSKV